MEEERSKKIITIPNVLSFFRFVLAFLFAWVYLHAETPKEYYIAALIIVISAITDVVDGRIARRFHMVSELGKILDPVADKFTQGILALCLIKHYHLMIVLVVVFLLKEAYMSIRGITVLRESGRNDGAKWYGKLNTVVLYLVMFLLLIFPEMPENLANVLIVFCLLVMFFAWFSYGKMYHQILKEIREEKQKKGETSRKSPRTNGDQGKKILSFLLIAMLSLSIAIPSYAWEGDSISVVALGDSIAKGYSGTGEPITPYSQLLADELGWKNGLNINYVNYGKNGLATKGLNEKILVKEEVIADLEQADIITVTIGSNDLLKECKKEAQEILNTNVKYRSANDALGALQKAVTENPLLLIKVVGALSSWDYTTFEEQWDAAMNTINEHKKESAQVIVTNLYNPVANLELPGTMNKVVESIIGNMNDIITAQEKTYGYQVIDVFDSEVAINTQPDGLHPDQTGQDMIAALLSEAVIDPAPVETLEEKEAREAKEAKILAKKKAAQKAKQRQKILIQRMIVVALVGVIVILATLIRLRLRKRQQETILK